MEIITDIPNEQLEAESAAALQGRLEEVFSKIFVQPPEESEFKSLISEAGELRIEDICKIASVLEITENVDIIKTAICNSKSLRMCNETTVKSSSARPDQNTLILREIPTSTPSGSILQIFTDAVCTDGTPCPAAQSVRSDMNDTWFVTFQSEVDAKNALAAIRKREFNGKPVLARLKTESTHKSFYSAPTSAAASGKGAGNFSPQNGRSPLPSPGASSQQHHLQPQQSPQPGQPAAFFGMYPVPPPHYTGGNNGAPMPMSVHGGHPNAYAGMIGADGKTSFPPHQAMFAPMPPHMQQPGYGHPQMGGFPHQQQGQYNQYSNRRYNSSNNNNYNNRRGFAGNGNFQNGGQGQRNQRNFQQLGQQPGQMVPGVATPSAGATQPPVVAVGEGGDSSPRSGSAAGSTTTAEGSTSQDSAIAAASASPVIAGQQQGAVVTGTPLPNAGAVLPTPMMPNNFPNYMHQGGGANYFPGYTFGGMPGPFGGFPNGPGMGPPMNPMGYPAPGYFPMPMNAPLLNGVNPAQGFHPNQQSPRGGGDGGMGNRGRNHSSNPQFQQQQQFQQQRSSNHQGPPQIGQQGAPRSGLRGGSGAVAPPISSDITPTTSATTVAINAEEKSSVKPGPRERKNDKEKGSGDAKKAHPTSEGTEVTSGGGRRGGKDSGNSSLPDHANPRKMGNAGANGGASGATSARKNGERNGSDRKKAGREKGRDGNKDDARLAPRRAADFNMEADFPNLIDSENSEKQNSSSSAATKPIFDYANAVRKATQPIYEGAAVPNEAAAAVHHQAPEKATSKKTGDETKKAVTVVETVVAPNGNPVEEPTKVQLAEPQANSNSVVEDVGNEKHLHKEQKEKQIKTRNTRNPSDAPAVESFTFGSVVAPVVNTIDRSGFHFGVDGNPVRGLPVVPSSSAAASTSGAASTTVSADRVDNSPTFSDEHHSATSVDEATKVAAGWGAKKSFADILLHSSTA